MKSSTAVRHAVHAAHAAIVGLTLLATTLAAGQAQEYRGPVPAPPEQPADSRISEYVREVFQDRAGDMWFGTNGEGVCRYDGVSLDFFDPDDGFGGWAVRGIAQADDGAMWFATDGGVTRYDAGRFTTFTRADGLSASSVWSLMIDRGGTVWAGTHDGVCRFDGTSFVPFPLPRVTVEDPESRFSPLVVFAMFEDPAGDLWFGTDGEGVHRYDGTGFTSYTARDGLAANMVRCIGGDRRGGIWIGTDGGGVSRYDGTSFRTFTAADGLNNDRIFEVHEDSAGTMWFSTLGAGASRYDGTSFAPFGVEQGLSINELPCPCGSGRPMGDCHGPGGGHVQEIFEDRDGVLWFGCSGGLFRLEGDRFVHVTRTGPWPETTRRAATPSDAFGPFAALPGGEWRLGDIQIASWHVGPGGHSLRASIRGSDGGGNPWASLLVLHEHPRDDRLRSIGWHPDIPAIGRGTRTGFVAVGTGTAESTGDLHQPGTVRRMRTQWTFGGPDQYRTELLEDPGTGDYAHLGEWAWTRSPDGRPATPVPLGSPPTPAPELAALQPLLGLDWTPLGGRLGVARTSIVELDHLAVVHARVHGPLPDGRSGLQLEAFIHHHVGTGTLRCLALHHSGDVYEGDVTALEGGSIRFELLRHRDGEAPAPVAVQVDPGADGSSRVRTWTGAGAGRTLRSDTRHVRPIGR